MADLDRVSSSKHAQAPGTSYAQDSNSYRPPLMPNLRVGTMGLDGTSDMADDNAADKHAVARYETEMERLVANAERTRKASADAMRKEKEESEEGKRGENEEACDDFC